MPKLNDNTMENNNTVGHFGFSAVRMDELGASEYTLATIVVDVSGSVYSFEKDLEKCVKEAIAALRYSPRSNNLMLRVLKFNSGHEEVHGFKLLENCNADDYNGQFQPGGMTACFDATVDAIEGTKNYASTLNSNDIDVNGIIIVLTDGADNESKFGATTVGERKMSCVTDEALESVLSILVAVNSQDFQSYLDNFNKEGKFDQMIAVNDASASTLAKINKFISKSIVSQSQSLGTGGPSQAIVSGSLTI